MSKIEKPSEQPTEKLPEGTRRTRHGNLVTNGTTPVPKDD